MRRPFICSSLLICLLFARMPLSTAGDAGTGTDTDTDKDKDKKEKPKEKPFRVSVWSAFQDLSYTPPQFKPDPNEPTDETRPATRNWQGFGRRGQWTSIVVEIENTTEDTNYRGSVALNLNAVNENQNGQIPYKTNYRKDFDLAPKSKQQVRFSVLCKEDWSEASETLNLEISAGSQFKSRSLMLSNLDISGEDLILVVTKDNSGAFRYLSNRKGRMADDDEGLDAHYKIKEVASVEPEDLPRRWHDLTMANLVIIDGPPAEKFNEDQLEAIRSYVQAGGHVLLMAGEDPARLRGFWEDLCGITVKNTTNIKSIDEINPPFEPVSKNWQMTVMDVEVRNDARRNAVVKRNHATDCVEMVRRFYGAGSVTFLPFSLNRKGDAEFEGWKGRMAIPSLIVERSAPSTLFGQTRTSDIETVLAQPPRSWMGRNQPAKYDQDSMIELRKSLDKSFSNDTPVIMQKSATVLSFLMLYLLFAVPGNYFLFGWFRRREIAWLAVPVWAATFSVIAYAVGYLGQTGKLTVNELSVIEVGPREDVGIARTFFGIYAPVRDDYQVEFPPAKPHGSKDLFDAQAAAGHLVNMDEDVRTDYPPLSLIDTDSGIVVDRMLVQQRSTRRLEVVHRAKIGDGLDVRVRPNPADDRAIDIEIQNDTGYELFNPVFIKDEAGVELGGPANAPDKTLAAGASNKLLGVGGVVPWQTKKDVFFGKQFGALMGKQVSARSAALQDFLKNRVTRFHDGVVCAWIKDGLLAAKIYNGSSKHTQMEIGKFEGLTLLLVPVALQHGGQSSTRAVKNGPIPLRFSTAYAKSVAANNPVWNQVSGGVAPMELTRYNQGQANSANANVVALEFNAPENRSQLHYDGCYLRLRFKIGVVGEKPGDLEAPAPKIMSGNAIVSIEVQKDGSYQWEELSNMIIHDFKPGKPFKSDPIEISLGKPKLVRDRESVMRILIRAETTDTPTALQVKDLDVRVSDE